MLDFMLSRSGGATLWLSVITGPGLARSQATHCWMMRLDCAHLLHAHQVAVVAVAGLADRDVEVHAVVDLVGLRLAQVPRDAGAAQHRAGEAQVERALGRDHADAHGALLPDAVVGEQRLVLVDVAGEALREVVDEVQQRALAVLVHALDVALRCGSCSPCTAASRPAGRGRRRPGGSRPRACARRRPPRTCRRGLPARGSSRSACSSRRSPARARRATAGGSAGA